MSVIRPKKGDEQYARYTNDNILNNESSSQQQYLKEIHGLHNPDAKEFTRGLQED